MCTGFLKHMHAESSLVPRPSPPLVFVACSMRTRRGKAWEIWSRAVTLGRQSVDPQGAMPEHNNSVSVALSLVSWTTNGPSEHSGLQPSDWHTRKGFEILHWALPPACVSTLYITACDQTSQAFPSIFAHCNQSKTGGRNSLGTDYAERWRCVGLQNCFVKRRTIQKPHKLAR